MPTINVSYSYEVFRNIQLNFIQVRFILNVGYKVYFAENLDFYFWKLNVFQIW